MNKLVFILLIIIILINSFSFWFSILMDEFTDRKIRKGDKHEKQKRRHK